MSIDTPITYTRKEAEKIRSQFTKRGVELDCPRCGEPLHYGPSVERQGHLLSEVFCQACHRVVMIRIADHVSLDRR